MHTTHKKIKQISFGVAYITDYARNQKNLQNSPNNETDKYFSMNFEDALWSLLIAISRGSNNNGLGDSVIAISWEVFFFYTR